MALLGAMMTLFREESRASAGPVSGLPHSKAVSSFFTTMRMVPVDFVSTSGGAPNRSEGSRKDVILGRAPGTGG